MGSSDARNPAVQEGVVRRSVFVLVDCDNFFVSCERAFRPDLWRKPVLVMSNNDGCVVARSNEVKALGVPMGIPMFKIRKEVQQHGITTFSGNFSLYGDFSQRVVRILEAISPHVEVYSVDESFLEISELEVPDYTAWARELHDHVLQLIGIPVSVGVAPTKTLAKAAAEKAKHTPECYGGFSLMADGVTTEETAEERRLALLKEMTIGEVWGVGWRTAPNLQDRGVSTAYDLSKLPHDWVRQQLTVRGLATVQELQGTPYFQITDEPVPQKTLAVTRTFPHKLQAWHHLEGKIATFAARAAMKLRRGDQIAGAVGVFIAGDRHRDGQNYRRVSTVVPLLQAANDTGGIITAALKGLHDLYDADYSYRRGGVVLLDLAPAAARQLSWLVPIEQTLQQERKARVMRAMDALNYKYNTQLIWHAAEHKGEIAPTREFQSDAYTTRWTDLPKIKA